MSGSLRLMATATGRCTSRTGDGPWPGVLVFPDAGGARETFGQVGEFYPARHGFAVPDNPTYDAAAEAPALGALERLYRDHLGV
jgi:hypothetical protein